MTLLTAYFLNKMPFSPHMAHLFWCIFFLLKRLHYKCIGFYFGCPFYCVKIPIWCRNFHISSIAVSLCSEEKQLQDATLALRDTVEWNFKCIKEVQSHCINKMLGRYIYLHSTALFCLLPLLNRNNKWFSANKCIIFFASMIVIIIWSWWLANFAFNTLHIIFQCILCRRQP